MLTNRDQGLRGRNS